MKMKKFKQLIPLISLMVLLSVGGTAQGAKVNMKEIPFSAIEGVQVGNAQDDKAKTGVTVLCFPAGAKTGVDISGGGPASRETPVLDPTKEAVWKKMVLVLIQALRGCHWLCSRIFMICLMAVLRFVRIVPWDIPPASVRFVKMSR